MVPVVETVKPVRCERAFSLQAIRLVATPRRIAVYRRRRGYGARAGVHRGRRVKWSTAVPIMPSEKATCCSYLRLLASVFFGQAVQ